MENPVETESPLAAVEARLRNITPSTLYADAWIAPSTRNLTRVFNHLRTLYRILHGYLPRQVVTSLPKPGTTSFSWEQGTLMFTDLSGFTPLLEKNAEYGKREGWVFPYFRRLKLRKKNTTFTTPGKEGADALLEVLNSYFTEMLDVVSKSGGNLLEFTGDALLVQFPTDQRENDTNRAVRAGLRMQRVMKKFEEIEILGEKFSLGMRIGIHVGNFLIADIGTPHRMEHILLGQCVLQAKKAEGSGKIGKVNLTPEARARVADEFRFEDNEEDFSLIVDDLTEEQLGDFDIIAPRTRMASMVLFDISPEGLITAITDSVDKVEPLASFIPRPTLKLLVENAASRGIPPDFPEATLLFINLLGLPDDLESAAPEDQTKIIAEFSRIISMVNAEIEAQGGVMKKVTYHHAGPDIMAFFGVPEAHTNDTLRAVRAAQKVVNIVKQARGIQLGDETFKLSCHIGMTRGRVFAAEIGQRQGRREFNVMGNTVNTAARLMDHAESNQVLVTEEVYGRVKDLYEANKLENVQLKGRSQKLILYEVGKTR